MPEDINHLQGFKCHDVIPHSLGETEEKYETPPYSHYISTETRTEHLLITIPEPYCYAIVIVFRLHMYKGER
jgi:hypothetical protein